MIDKHEKAKIVKAITLLQKEDCRKEEALEILYGLVGLDYAASRHTEKAVSGAPPGRSRPGRALAAGNIKAAPKTLDLFNMPIDGAPDVRQ